MSVTAGSYRWVRIAFRTAAIVEAVSWAGMLAAMVVKYPLQGTPLGVTIWGWVHGIAWVVFIAACLAAAIRYRWVWWLPLTGVAVSVLPFMTVPFDIWAERTGRLAPPRPASPEPDISTPLVR